MKINIIWISKRISDWKTTFDGCLGLRRVTNVFTQLLNAICIIFFIISNMVQEAPSPGDGSEASVVVVVVMTLTSSVTSTRISLDSVLGSWY